MSQYIGDFHPEAHVKGEDGESLTAFICNKNSATFRAFSLFKIISQMYKVFIENNPIRFISIEEKVPLNKLKLYLKDTMSTRKKIEEVLKNAEKIEEIYVVCQNLEHDFHDYFSTYDFVEAAGGIVERKEKYLFIKRNGFWDIPKGKMEEGELPDESAIREVEEECGILRPKITGDICQTFHTYDYNGIPTLKKTYWYDMTFSGPKDVIPQIEEGITEAVWLKEKEISIIKENTFLSIIDVLDKKFGKGSL